MVRKDQNLTYVIGQTNKLSIKNHSNIVEQYYSLKKNKVSTYQTLRLIYIEICKTIYQLIRIKGRCITFLTFKSINKYKSIIKKISIKLI